MKSETPCHEKLSENASAGKVRLDCVNLYCTGSTSSGAFMVLLGFLFTLKFPWFLNFVLTFTFQIFSSTAIVHFLAAIDTCPQLLKASLSHVTALEISLYLFKPFLKGKILRSCERGVNSILTTILRFWPTSWKDRIFCLVASDSARREDHFQKKIVQNGPSLQIL